MSNNDDEAFVIYHNGVALKLIWRNLPPLVRVPAVRLCYCNYDDNFESLLLVLTADGCLYRGILNASTASLQLDLQRNDVVDVDYCRGTRELYIVTNFGSVYKQVFGGGVSYRANAWQILSFDPLELSEEGVCIKGVCCSAQGVLFRTKHDDIYVLGSCGEVFSAETQPIKMRLFEDGKVLRDVVAGDDFFVLLLLDNSKLAEKSDILNVPRQEATANLNNTYNNDESSPRRLELNSKASLQSLSSNSSLQSHNENSFAENIQQLLLQGYRLLNTQLYTFGTINGGLLGTGDHIKRSSVNNVQKLDSIGVCSIAAGREHTVVRTLDGRLFHWGLNSQQQLNAKLSITDLSAPTELKLDRMEISTQERCILEACCGDYQTVLLNAHGNLRTISSKQQINYDKTFFNVQMGTGGDSKYPNVRLLHVAGDFTLQNLRLLQPQYNNCLINLQSQLQLLLKNAHAIEMLGIWHKKIPSASLRGLLPVCTQYERLMYLLSATLYSIEELYRDDVENPAELTFIRYYRECTELFVLYSKAYCDIFSVDGFREAKTAFSNCSDVPLLPEQNGESDLARIFQQPFQIFPIFIQFIEQLLKTRPEFKEHLLAWEGLQRQSCIHQELAVNTQEFWNSNERNVRIRDFRRKHRRVILTSSAVPLKLANNALSMTSTSFILFSDCLCQLGSTLYTYPLCTLWLKNENERALRIITPEKSFTLLTRTAHDKMIWHDQLETSIVAALCRPVGSKVPNVRKTAYIFSREHSKYANVHAYGKWRNGLMHGSCYLEYPDGTFYFGEMCNGEIEGYGKMVLPSVGIYEGYFRAGIFNGHGIYEMKDNKIYEGNFRDGLFHGHGTLRSNQYTYVGEFQANAKSGYGVLDDMTTGEKYMGMFADNKRTGAGTCITECGDYFEGIFASDELLGTGIAVFENDYYYEGELTINGPNGKGTYYMPSSTIKLEDSLGMAEDECYNYHLIGNVISGQLGGNWQDVRIQNGSIAINRQFSKYPKSIGELVVDNNRKWRSLFDNFEAQILGSNDKRKETKSTLTTDQIWNRIAVFMSTQQRARERAAAQQDTMQATTRNFFARNIQMGFTNGLDSANKKSISVKSALLDIRGNIFMPRRIQSQETLCVTEMKKTDSLHSINATANSCCDDISFRSLHLDNSFLNYSQNSLHSSYESALNITGDSNCITAPSNINNNNSFSSQIGLEYIPNFGINSLTEEDVASIKEYLQQAFKECHHPLYLLNQRVANCFYYSYGCWKVKPTPILAKQAMREWESISKRIYRFVRKMFPALPEDYCVIESTHEVISHITILYPIVLSEGIYSTLFVLYANKYSRKDEMYRQNLIYAEKLSNCELTELLGLERFYLAVVESTTFGEAIETLKQLQEKFSPKAMLTEIENCMQQVTDAFKDAEKGPTAMLAADNMMPLTVFVVLRAAVPHLGAELALLDDLTGNAHFQLEMNGLAGYCYTTLKAAYEHITAKPLQKTQ